MRRLSDETRWDAVAGCGLVLAGLCGCASPSPPRAPSLRLPEQAAMLEARRTGDAVRVTWEVPRNTTDGDSNRPGMSAVVCREAPGPAGAAAAPCVPVGRMQVVPGAASFSDALPPGLRSGPPVLLAYRVELLSGRGRSAGQSDAAYAAGGEAPPAAGMLTLTARRHALQIRWTPQGSSVGMELTRTTTATAAGPARGTADKARAGRKGAGLKVTPAQHAVPGQGKDADQVLMMGAMPKDGVDPGGVMDRSVRDQDAYRYVAQRVRRVTLKGHALELRGLASPEAAVIYRDIFPAEAPTGLASVAGISFTGAASTQERFIDLSWDVSPEDSVTGYNVYRRGGARAESFLRLNPHLLAVAGYHDLTVVPGVTYSYRVTALDRNGVESAPSAEIHDTVRP